MKQIILIMIIFFGVNSNAQHLKKQIELQQLILRNENFEKVLCEIVENERKCEYYSCNLLFLIDMESKSPTLFNIESIFDRNIAFGLEPRWYFYFKEHLFLVRGNFISDFFEIFDDRKKIFEYLKYDPFYKDPMNNSQKVYYFTDDSFSQWQYLYEEDVFKLQSKYSLCQ